MSEEYKKFWLNFSFQPFEYRKKPLKVFPRSKFDIASCLKNLSLSRDLTIIPSCIHEPISFLQRGMGESLKFKNLLDKASDMSDLCERLAYIAAFSVSYLHILSEGRNCKSFDSVLGETYELIDQKDRMLLIGEKVSINPEISASHTENELWEIQSNIGANFSIENTKIIYDVLAKIKYIFKNNNQIFISNRPSLICHDSVSENRWLEYKGKQTIQHYGSKARVELLYLGCEKYSKENNIQGKIFNENDEEVGILEGNYLTKLIYTKTNSEPIIIWKIDAEEKIFFDHFSFTEFTLQLNDPIYPVKCPTDSRLRKDMRSYEEADFEEADRQKYILEKKQADEEKERQLKEIVYKPKWFKKVFDDDLNDDFYVYERKYWSAKLDDNYDRQ